MPPPSKRSVPARRPRQSSSRRPSRSRRTQRRDRRARLLLLLVSTTLGAALAGVALWMSASSVQSVDLEQGFVQVELEAHELDVDGVEARLRQAGVSADSGSLRWAKWRTAPTARFEPGTHWLPRAASNAQLVAMLSRRTSRPLSRVTIPEGWDSYQIAARLAERGVCSASAFLKVVHDPRLAERWLGSSSLEGYLYPATYELRLNTEASAVARRLVDAALRRFEPVFDAAGSPRMTAAGLEANDIVTLASVVEKEAAHADEQGAIASVFINRLTDAAFRPRRMLQSDPTAGYGCKRDPTLTSCQQYDGRIVPQMLRDPNNPYNTYKNAGLPPTPVGNPSAAAVRAVLNAPKTDYLFFFAARDGKAHVFSRTLEEHRAAITEARDSR